jgi:hypothetical protein
MIIIIVTAVETSNLNVYLSSLEYDLSFICCVSGHTLRFYTRSRVQSIKFMKTELKKISFSVVTVPIETIVPASRADHLDLAKHVNNSEGRSSKNLPTAMWILSLVINK